MNYFEIKTNGKAYIRTDSGTLIREVGNGEPVQHADFNHDESMFSITYESGKAEIRDCENILVGKISDEGVRKVFLKKDICMIYYVNGTEKDIKYDDLILL